MSIQIAEPVELAISPEKVFFIITKAREFDAKVEPAEPDRSSDSGDGGDRAVFEDLADDATLEELRAAIDQLGDDEVVDLIALAWLGRGDFDRASFAEARELATERHRAKSSPYLTGIPTLGDYLEEGLAELGYSCADFELERL